MTYIREHHIVTQVSHSNECDAVLEAHEFLYHSAHENQTSTVPNYSFQEKLAYFDPAIHLTLDSHSWKTSLCCFLFQPSIYYHYG